MKMHFTFPVNSASSAFKASKLSPKIRRLSKMSAPLPNPSPRWGEGLLLPSPSGRGLGERVIA
jgi:hypothetical protein